MKTVSCFVEMDRFLNNSPGVLSPFGELSRYSRTFTKEDGTYRSQAAGLQGFTLYTQSVIDNNISKETNLDTNEVDTILTIVKDAVAYFDANTMPYDSENFREQIKIMHLGTVEKIDHGVLIDIGLKQYPTSLELEIRGTLTLNVKVWMADSFFRDQYTGYSITVVPPLDEIDDLLNNFTLVKTYLEGTSASKLIKRVQAAKDYNPDTVVDIQEFRLVNRFNDAEYIKTEWGYLIYGNEGNFLDYIKDATQDFITKHTKLPIQQWEIAFPEIFQRTEFYIVPRWDKQATFNLTDRSSLYSGLITYKDHIEFNTRLLTWLENVYVTDKSLAIQFPFRMLNASILPGTLNDKNKVDFKKLYPDYMPIPTTSLDFGRMRVETQEWSEKIQELLLIAETAVPHRPLPKGYKRITRYGVFFVSLSIDNINYLVAAKWNPQFS